MFRSCQGPPFWNLVGSSTLPLQKGGWGGGVHTMKEVKVWGGWLFLTHLKLIKLHMLEVLSVSQTFAQPSQPWLPKFWILGSLKNWKHAFPDNMLFRAFCSPKLSLESWIFYCLYEFLEYPSNITIGISVIVYSIPQAFVDMDLKLMMVVEKSNWHT